MPPSARHNYDTPWKSALTHYFPEFVAFYFPRQWADIDWSQSPRFLDQELEQANRGDKPASLIADKLVSIRLHQGNEQWVLVHVEVQAQRDNALPRRVFAYNYRIFELHQRPVASLVVLADEAPDRRPDRFRYCLLGTEMGIRFVTAKVMDHAPHLSALLAGDNPFALITAAHLLTQQTHGAPQRRLAAKWRLIKILYQRRWEKRRIIDLFRVINWLMKLPDELNRELWQGIVKLERRQEMDCLTPLERIFLNDGRQQGLEQGRQEGARDGVARVLEQQLVTRYGPLPDVIRQQLANADLGQLERWSVALLAAPRLEDVFRGAE